MVADQAEIVAVADPIGRNDKVTHRDARLDEPPRDQEMLVDRRRAVILELVRLAVAVAVAKPRVFATQVEGFDQPARREHVEG